jgi:hypothetical protein
LEDAAEAAKKKTMGQKAYDYVYGAPPKDGKETPGESPAGASPEGGDSLGERIAKDPLELEILETQLPEKVDFLTMPQITRGDWEVEWRKIKGFFDQTMAIMHEEFSDKQRIYKEVESKLQKNADF